SSGDEPATDTSGWRMKKRKGDGLISRSARYTSKQSSGDSVASRWERTIWKASPARMRSLASSTAATKSSRVNVDVHGGGSGAGPTGVGVYGDPAPRRATASSKAATASS